MKIASHRVKVPKGVRLWIFVLDIPDRPVKVPGMPRAPRIEFPGAIYHVMNRGNYRQELFSVYKTAEAFERTLFETGERFGWRLHAYVVMTNHFHLALETPGANLSTGMQWLQSVFSNRFNKFCGEMGHVFQGRFKALLVEPGVNLLRVVDYIHLNPVRAGHVDLNRLPRYPYSSFPKWFLPKGRRPSCLVDEVWKSIGGFTSGEAGLRRYWTELVQKRESLLHASEQADKEMCRGWCIGSKEYGKRVLDELDDPSRALETAKSSPGTEDNESVWNRMLAAELELSGHSEMDLFASRKSADWKLQLASRLKACNGVSNRWLASRLNMGHPCSASKNITHWKNRQKSKA